MTVGLSAALNKHRQIMYLNMKMSVCEEVYEMGRTVEVN
jgi:hypothetical protein